ncbi:tetraspanin-8-like isoform X1 [Siniperca chuatsi]|uniref:tetraspanin-8-like isoform X1 n=2 Tax=Siniperca chuatsi TaxID=119488 RepID=UPI001CE0E0B2|nr:tetraspanin-8-like isoform X1 [Siniperca chuatsi]
MGRVNVWLKRSYIIVISVIAILSALLLAFTLFSHGYFHENEEIDRMITGLRVLYGISIITLLLAITGLYGACKEKQWALIVFAVGMILNSLFMIACNIGGVASRPQVRKDLKMQYLHMLPLANASENVIDSLDKVQMEWQCCGLDQGYLDWGYNISESCLCTEESTNPCVAAPRNSSLFEHVVSDEPIMIYKEPCLPYLIAYVVNAINATLGVLLGVILLWVVSVVLCIAILCRLSRKEDTPTVVYSPEAKEGNYTVLAGATEYT